MRILIMGAGGFIGRNLASAIRAARPGDALDLCTRATPAAVWDEALAHADIVFHLAGINRPADPRGFDEERALTTRLLTALEAAGNRCPVVYASSIQAAGTGRFAGSPYGANKRACEDLCFAHAAKTGASALVFRLPGVFGKWSRPDYNSVVATFCDCLAHEKPLDVHDPDTPLELLYIDDLIAAWLDLLAGGTHRCTWGPDGTCREAPDGDFCCVPGAHRTTVGELAGLLSAIARGCAGGEMPPLPAGSLAAALAATYVSFLPPGRAVRPLTVHTDPRGSFTELFRTAAGGQCSLNISAPGAVKGMHWHASKWEVFVVIAGHGVIEQRRVGGTDVTRVEVDGAHPTAVTLLPGCTHCIRNLSETEPLVTWMWASECYDPARPDTYREEV